MTFISVTHDKVVITPVFELNVRIDLVAPFMFKRYGIRNTVQKLDILTEVVLIISSFLLKANSTIIY
jgi:hypothetical protein